MLKDTLRLFRETVGMSQCELARRVGVNQTMICHYEKGLKNPNIVVLARLADELNCTTDELLGRKVA